MRNYAFKFTPSLLDAFQTYLDCDSLYEKFYGHSDEPTLTSEEFEKQKRQELVDKINRVPFESEAADKGSCLNEIVDCIVLNSHSTRDDIELKSTALPDSDTPCIVAKKGDREFVFDTDFCLNIAKYFESSICQMYVEAPIQTKHGSVLLYGYPDYVRRNVVYDLKTTSKYEFGKYSKYWQQHVYPFALVESKDCTDITEFEFTAFQLSGGTSRNPRISGDMYKEVYAYDHARSEAKLRGICEQFGDFLLNNRDLITDEKIFGGDKKQ